MLFSGVSVALEGKQTKSRGKPRRIDRVAARMRDEYKLSIKKQYSEVGGVLLKTEQLTAPQTKRKI
jgi:hypothetical protein